MYGKHRRTLRGSWHDFRASAHYLLQVASFLCPLLLRAEFTGTDSDTLYDIYSRVGDIAEDVELMKNRSSDWAIMRGHLQEIEDSVTPGGYVYDRLGNIGASAASIAASVVNIESAAISTANGISSLSDMLDSRLLGISNAIASIPLCNVVLTNFLNASGNVDMSIVSNLLVSSSALPYYTLWFPSVAPYFNDFLADYFGTTDLDFDYAKQYYAMSQMGFSNYLLVDALFPSYPRQSSFSGGFDNLLFYSWLTWKEGLQDGTGSTLVDWPYSIFDAYNTLGLGVLTNQAAILLSVAHANTNLLTQILSVLDNDEHGLQAIATAVSTSSASLGTSGAAELDHSANYDLPQWEPSYSREVDSNTNVFEFDDAMRTMTQSMFGDTTNQTGSLASEIGKIQPGGDLSLAFDFSGFNLSPALQNFAPWSVSTSFSGLEEVKDFFKTLSRYMFYVLDLCLVIIGCRRIQRAIIGDVGIL